MVQHTCQIHGCDSPVRSRGWCNAHYKRWYRYGDPQGDGPQFRDRSLTPTQRFWRRVDKTDDCWIFTGGLTHNGYSQVWVNGAPIYGHRFSYEELVAPIPAGMTLDHLCRRRACVNPSHLEPVSAVENTMRGGAAPAINARKTACVRGHAFDSANTHVGPDGKRYCRACRRIRAQRAA